MAERGEKPGSESSLLPGGGRVVERSSGYGAVDNGGRGRGAVGTRPRVAVGGCDVDRGWAWAVALAACGSNLLVMGTVKSAGIILNILGEHFGASALETNAFVIINVLSMIVWTPVTSWLTERVSVRVLVMVGGGLVVAGMLLTAVLDSSLYLTYLSLGLICGTGGAFILPPSYIIINQYFREKRSKALGLATMGMGVGSLLLSPFLAFSFAYYGYAGTFLVMAALFMHIQVIGALMRPPRQHRPLSSTPKDADTERLYDDEEKKQGSEENKGDEEEHRFLTRKSDCDNLLVRREKRAVVVTGAGRWRRLFSNPTFLLYMVAMAGSTLPAATTFLPPLALELGISTATSSLLLSINGLGDTIGRVASGFFFDRLYDKKQLYHSVAGVLAGLLVVAYAFAPSTPLLATVAVIHGILEGVFSAQRTAVPFEFVSVDDMSSAVGLIILAECLGMLIGPIMQSFLKDALATYSVGFLAGGVAFAATSALLVIDYVCRNVTY